MKGNKGLFRFELSEDNSELIVYELIEFKDEEPCEENFIKIKLPDIIKEKHISFTPGSIVKLLETEDFTKLIAKHIIIENAKCVIRDLLERFIDDNVPLKNSLINNDIKLVGIRQVDMKIISSRGISDVITVDFDNLIAEN